MATHSESLKTLIFKRGQVKATMTRFENYLISLEGPQPDTSQLKKRLSCFETCLESFEKVQSEIEMLDETTSHEQERNAFENTYFRLLSKAEEYVSTFVTTATAQNSSFRSENDPLCDIKLPRIGLPNFTGSYEEWFGFFDSFSSLIDSNRSLTDIQKFRYLKSCLRDEAADLISSIEISADSYVEAWDLLRERYDNKRYIINKHVLAVLNIPAIHKESCEGLRKIISSVQNHIRALKSLKCPTDSWDVLLIPIVVQKLDSITAKEWDRSLKGDQIPTQSEFLKFLNEKCTSLEILNRNNNCENSSGRQLRKGITNLVTKEVRCCPICSGMHHFSRCDIFLKLSIPERINKVRERHLCTNCLGSNHTTFRCNGGKCKQCQKKHNTLLHLSTLEREENRTPQSSTNNEQEEESSNPLLRVESSHVATNLHCIRTAEVEQVLLATAVVIILDSQGNTHKCRALLDSGSQINFIASSLIERLNLNKKNINMSIIGVNRKAINVHHSVEVSMHSQYNNFQILANCVVLNKITENVPISPINISNLNIPGNLKLADPLFHDSNQIDLLLGADIFWSLLCAGQIRLSNGRLFMQKTKLGWIISGKIRQVRNNNKICNLALGDLDDQLRQFWELEEVNSVKALSQDEQTCENHYKESYQRNKEGRFVVSLPFKEDPSQIGTSRDVALKRFYNLERKLNKDPELKVKYTEFIHEYLRLGHMSMIEDDATTSAFYLPHHAVLKEDSATTKLRVVFDASAKGSNGSSLNDILRIGPTVQDDLVNILLRFRLHRYVLGGDIEKMYRQVMLHPSHRKYQRIFWRDDEKEDVRVFELNTVTYGMAPAAFLSIRSLQQTAFDHLDSLSDGANIVLRDFYVDNLLTGSDSSDHLIKIRNEVIQILQTGCFPLRQWISNSNKILSGIKGDSNNTILNLDKEGTIKTLGLRWNSNEDYLQFLIKPFEVTSRITKRTILSDTAQIFDPLGLVGPVIIKAKGVLRELWKSKIGWDQSIPLDLHTMWFRFRNDLKELVNLRIPRRVLSNDISRHLEIHGFSDASEYAYGACVYIRSPKNSGGYTASLLCAKSRIAPIKVISIPRLELCGAVLLAKLINKIKYALSSFQLEYHYWTDSTIVLAWLNSESSTLKTFVANRVSEIQTLTEIGDWRHVASAQNPADLISRGLAAIEILHCDLWWSGPTWLSEASENWPVSNIVPTNDEELESRNLSNILMLNDDIAQSEISRIIGRYSSFNKLLRVIARCLRFCNNSRAHNPAYTARFSDVLDKDELDNARVVILRSVQRTIFGKEFRDLSNNGKPSNSSHLLALSIFLDETGLIRVGGRLLNSPLSYSARHPILLPYDHPLTMLIIRQAHIDTFHGGREMTLAAVRQSYWPVRARTSVKNLLSKCVTCFRHNPRIHQPIMGNLPASRITPSRPFSISGVDFCGPFYVKEGSRKTRKFLKAYACLFICFSTKAIHIEVVSNLTSDAFIAALRRFVARRGVPSDLHSDNGTNFVGANQQLGELRELFLSQPFLQDINVAYPTIRWHFNPAKSPHFGGLWESAIKSAKLHLRKVASNSHLTFEEIATLFSQIEAVLNSRPLTAITSDPNDFSFLTPSHFLTGDSLISIPEPSITHIPLNRLSRWQHVQQMREHFWKRWSLEYLHQLQRKGKWMSQEKPQLERNQLVLIQDDSVSSQHWKIGRILDVHPGNDGIVRAVSVKNPIGTVLRRAANRVCPLPIEVDNTTT